MTTAKKRIIFCDFDGTITVNDNIVAIIKHFNPPGWEEIATSVLSQQISIRDGVGQMFRLLPTSKQKEVVEYGINNVQIRDGFAEPLNIVKMSKLSFM